MAQGQLDYGIGLNFNVPLVRVNQESSRFSAKAGYGLGLFANYPFSESSFGLSTRLEANRTPYYSSILGENVQVDALDLMLGLTSTVKKMDSTVFKIHLIPSAANVYTYDINNRKNRGLDLNNRFDVGVNLGTEIRLSKYTGLELSYTYRLLAKRKTEYYDAIPNSLSLKLNLHFNKEEELFQDRQIMSQMLDSLSRDTLFVVNSACSEKMTNEILSGLFFDHYNFSAFKVISVDELQEVKKNSSPLFYAYVGEYFGGEGEPLSNGIFLLDENFELTKHPYPFHTNYYEPLIAGPCFDTVTATISCIRSFNKRLHQ